MSNRRWPGVAFVRPHRTRRLGAPTRGGKKKRVTHPICVDCAIQTESDPDERDHHACDGCGLVVDALAASPARRAGCQRDLRSRPTDALPRRTRPPRRPIAAVRNQVSDATHTNDGPHRGAVESRCERRTLVGAAIGTRSAGARPHLWDPNPRMFQSSCSPLNTVTASQPFSRTTNRSPRSSQQRTHSPNSPSNTFRDRRPSASPEVRLEWPSTPRDPLTMAPYIEIGGSGP